MAAQDKFSFRRLDTIGVAAAEEDHAFLTDCFVETGDLDVLRNCEDPRRIVLGRTGVGKTALLQRLAEAESKVIYVKPENLALAHISNSTILTFVSELGVKLDIFFRLLWRHVLAVELIRLHFNIRNDDDRPSLLLKLTSKFKDARHGQALRYVEEYGNKFWNDTEDRIKEFTLKLETELRESIGSKLPASSLDIGGNQKLTEEERHEIVDRAQYVVNQVQMKELSQVIDVLATVLDDPQKRYYIVIDRLDEDWVEDRLRYLLIRALIETVKHFSKVRRAKVIVALRVDLLERVYRLTRDGGFQEEKYEPLNLPITWTKERLIEVLDARIDRLVRQRYTKQTVTHRELLPVLPRSMGSRPAIDYMIERTLMRPRDLIQFFNCCVRRAVDSPAITVPMLIEAEAEYSRDRIKSLGDEWYSDYPNLLLFARLLRGRKHTFRVDNITREECEKFCLDAVISGFQLDDPLSTAAKELADCRLSFDEFRRVLLKVLHKIGLIGLKLGNHEGMSWSIQGRQDVSEIDIEPGVRVSVHPVAWRELSIQFKDGS
jgi:hypothetical protein